VQFRNGPRHRRARIGCADDGAAGGVDEIGRDQQAGGARSAGLFQRAAIGNKRQVFVAGVFEGRDATDFTISFALPWGFQPRGQFLDSQAFELLQLKGYAIWRGNENRRST
jgi:hypothetical protein